MFLFPHSELSKSTESHFWQEIIEPTSLLDHNALRDELQMSVLSYDNDVLLQDLGKQLLQIQSSQVPY